MSSMCICEIESKDIFDEFIWSNFNVEDTLQRRKYYRIQCQSKVLCEIRCTYANECCMYIEIGMVRIKRLRKALIEMVQFLINDNDEIRRILTFVVAEDKLGIWMLKKVGFSLDVEWRECVVINGKKVNIQVWGVECRG